MMQDVSGYCFKLMSIVLDGNFWILIHELVQLHTPSHNKRIVRKLFHPDDLLVIFVLNITHNLFNQIFDGDHAGCSTILVYNNGHRTVALSEFRKKVFRFLTGGNKLRSEERRVGKEGRARWTPYREKKKEDEDEIIGL